MTYLMTELIKIKRSKKALTKEQIDWLIQEYSKESIPDYQMASLLMAIYLNGMNNSETHHLTQSMLHSGEVISFNNPKNFYVDKHSSGGIGDKTSMILSSIVACFDGIKVPMISGRGLGHTGGTLDKLESIPEFNIQIEPEKFKSLVNEVGALIIGQTKNICPADKKIYALRDVTSTVESLPLICASIMSKKLAEGIDGLVLDIKVGSGAFMKNLKDATALAQGLKHIGVMANKKMIVLITNMNQPLGKYSGNSLEIKECLEILENNKDRLYQDTRELSIILAAEMIFLSGKFKTLKQCVELCEEKISNGEALSKFKEIILAQDGKIELLPKSKYSISITSPKSGYVSEVNAENFGLLNILLKAGRAKSDDILDYTSGIELKFKIGDKIKKGQEILILHGSDLSLLKQHQDYLFENNSIILKSKPVKKLKLIIQKI
jgi:pyrimidine-nucleoside phosphorylase